MPPIQPEILLETIFVKKVGHYFSGKTFAYHQRGKSMENVLLPGLPFFHMLLTSREKKYF